MALKLTCDNCHHVVSRLQKGWIDWSTSALPWDGVEVELRTRAYPNLQEVPLQVFQSGSITTGYQFGLLICFTYSKFSKINPLPEDSIISFDIFYKEPHYRFFTCGTSPSTLVSMELYTLLGSPKPWSFIMEDSPISEDSSSDKCFDLASMWIQECANDHVRCPRISETRLPTRVIQVGGKSIQLRLYIISTKWQQHGKYITLSHCWGGSVPMKTTKNTLRDRTACINFELLPRTFRDAINIARRLKVDYIWIDSLCIVQDDAADWESESSKMANVYQNAFVTIMADRAKDSHGGCFISDRFFTYALPGQTSTNPGLIQVRRRRHWHSSPVSKLSTRGWVFQENKLSPRKLIYKEQELIWECESTNHCECGRALLYMPEPYQVKAWPNADGELTLNHFGKSAWSGIVETYSELGLSYSSDRLPAISALAYEYERRTGDVYHCGLFQSHLPGDLMWKVMQIGRMSPRHNTYYAPTWSCASVIGDVSFAFRSDATFSDVSLIEISSTLATANPYCPAVNGQVIVRGPTVNIHLKEVENQLPNRYTLVAHSAKAYHDEVFESEIFPDVVPHVSDLTINSEEVYTVLLMVPNDPNGPGDRIDPNETPIRLQGLVLRKSAANPNDFVRVGLMEFFHGG